MSFLTPQGTATIPGPVILGDEFRRMESLEFALDFWNKSAKFREPFENIWREVLDNYMVVPVQPGVDKLAYALGLQRIGSSRFSLESRSRLKDPETHQIIETLTAQAMGLLMGSPDYLKAVPIGSDDPEKARLLSRLLMAFMEAPGQYGVHWGAFKHAFLFGTSYLEVGWDARTRMQMTKVPAFDEATGVQTGWQLVPQEVPFKDEPLVREPDIFDIFPDPSGTRLHVDMKGIGKRFRLTAADALRLAKAGTYDLAPTQRAIARTQGTNSMTYGPDSLIEKFSELQNMPPDKYGMMTGFELWCETPFSRPDGSNRVITVLNGELVRDHINPNIDGALPFVEIVPNPIGGRHYGMSPAEVIRFLQDSADNFLMVFNDLADLAIRGPLLVGTAFGGDQDRLRERRPNDVIMCRNPEMVKPVPVEFNALTFAANEMARKSLRMREATGMTNPLQAIPSSGERTATETSELIRLASQRVQMMVALIERNSYPHLGRMIHSRLRQYGSPDGFVARLAGDVFEIDFDDIDVDADVRFVGSDQSISLAQQAANYNTFLTLVTTNPQAVEQFPDVVLRYARDVLKIPDAAAVIAKAVQMSQVLQMREAMLGAQPAGTPSPSADTSERVASKASQTEEAGVRLA